MPRRDVAMRHDYFDAGAELLRARDICRVTMSYRCRFLSEAPILRPLITISRGVSRDRHGHALIYCADAAPSQASRFAAIALRLPPISDHCRLSSTLKK